MNIEHQYTFVQRYDHVFTLQIIPEQKRPCQNLNHSQNIQKGRGRVMDERTEASGGKTKDGTYFQMSGNRERSRKFSEFPLPNQ